MEARPSSRRIVQDWFARNENDNEDLSPGIRNGRKSGIEESSRGYANKVQRSHSYRHPATEVDTPRIEHIDILGKLYILGNLVFP
jgi:hypothetical protein